MKVNDSLPYQEPGRFQEFRVRFPDKRRVRGGSHQGQVFTIPAIARIYGCNREPFHCNVKLGLHIKWGTAQTTYYKSG